MVRAGKIHGEVIRGFRMKACCTTSIRYIPDEVILEILYRLPVKSLLRCSSVSKLWFNLIYHDPRKFASSHLIHSQNNNPGRLIFNIIYPGSNKTIHNDLFYLDMKNNSLDNQEPILLLSTKCLRRVLVGSCNGLVCLSLLAPTPASIDLVNPSRREHLSLFPPTIYDDGWITICFGFGFDSSTSEYKVVFILKKVVNNDDEFYKCLVLTLGTKSWREIIISSWGTHRPSRMISRPAIFSNGVLYWRTRASKVMLISFDLQCEKFDVIQLPTECVSVEQKLVHLLEYKGSLCVAHLECSSDQQNCCKVHLHLLNDRIKQVWIKETFLLPFSLACYNTTRILGGLSNQVILYWFDGECFQFFDLHTRCAKVVKPRGAHTEYRLDNHVENITSLLTFVPQGACKLFDCNQEILLNQGSRTSGAFIFSTFPKKM